MVDRQVGGTLLEVLYGVASVGHHGLDQAVRDDDRGAWVVDELRLNSRRRANEKRPHVTVARRNG
jgi:hypothetical protein